MSIIDRLTHGLSEQRVVARQLLRFLVIGYILHRRLSFLACGRRDTLKRKWVFA
ncbi:hypothetical protein [Sphingomonas sp. RB1R13]|uniref:hypothetical protein n=1 Tax=Sphingomonas sp. RB1R13 TaxID=3096159 RepID=UPI002FC5E163